MSVPTIKDVAKLAGVSISTVSRVMNESKPVSPESRRKVLDAIKKLDFKPNELARSLVMRKSNMIGVIVKDIGISYMAQIVRGIEEIGRVYNYDILLSSTYGDIEAEHKIIEFMCTKQVEGIIMISEKINPETLFKLKSKNIPFVRLDKFYEYTDEHTVSIDYKSTCNKMTNYLVDEGHNSIVFISEDVTSRIGREKLAGFNEGVATRKVKSALINAKDITVQTGYDMGEEIFKLIKENNSTVVFASEDSLAIGFISYCYDNGLKVPQDISVAGFGDDLIASIYRPALTTIEEPYYDMGAISMRKLIKELRNEEKLKDVTILPSRIVERGSVATFTKKNK